MKRTHYIYSMKTNLFIALLFLSAVAIAQPSTKKNPNDFIPVGFVLVSSVEGDLNKDGVADKVLLIKGTDKGAYEKNEFGEMVDRNRRGIIVLFKKDNQYQIVLKNLNCFSSENEDGGVYYAPELSLEINKGNLYIHYAHGRYGYWKYTFRYRNSDFYLIGYDSSEGGEVVEKETSINFISKKKQEKVNTNESAEGGDEEFRETWTNITVTKLLKLRDIKDFENFEEVDMLKY
jgi:hypothetical protein